MIINNKIAPTLVPFSDLPIGTWYLDENNILCMKVSGGEWDNTFCPEMEDDGLCTEGLDHKVALVEIEINVLSYVKV